MREDKKADIDSQLQALRDMFRRRLDDDLPELAGLADALADQDEFLPALKALNRGLHKLAGSAGTFGFPDLGVTARTLEVRTQQWLQGAEPDQHERRDLQREVHALPDHLSETASPSTPQAPPSPAQNPPAPDSEIIVYLVEDDEQLGEELTRAFGHFGYPVRHYIRLAEAAEAMKKQQPDVLILDVAFHANGLNTIEQVALSPVLHDVDCPVIFLSDRDNFEIRVQAARIGAEGFFHKPLDIPRLIDRVEQSIRSKEDVPYRLLIVDDDEELAKHYALVLRTAGMESRVLSNPQRILEELDEYQPELVLMDVTMPGYSGVDLARVIRMHEDWISLPIVYLSAETDMDKQLSAMSGGGDDFLTKPISDHHLIAAVSVRAARMRQLNDLMVRDSLTGLLKHSRIKEQIALEFSRAKRDDTPLTVAMLDIDHFKNVNDTYGHAVGDRVIKALAHLLKQRLRKTDSIGRYGGEEFAVALPNCDVHEAQALLDDIRKRFKKIRFTAEEEDFTVTLSAGAVTARKYQDASDMLVAADETLYRAKHNGRDQVCFDA